MYPCPQCSNTYSSQSSLTRHAHNHRKTSQHQCSICQTVFARRDLLLRHGKVHAAFNGSPERINQGESDRDRPGQSALHQRQRQRRRCHTACTNCRKARTKCDGRQPCSTCMSLGDDCEYSQAQFRISESSRSTALDLGMNQQQRESPRTYARISQTAPNRGVPVRGTSNVEERFQQAEASTARTDSVSATQLHPQTTERDPSPYDDTFHGSAIQAFDDTGLGWGQGQDSLPVDGEIGMSDDFDSGFASSQWPGGTTWPWLHESLFLQDFDMALAAEGTHFDATDMEPHFGRLDQPDHAEWSSQTIDQDTTSQTALVNSGLGPIASRLNRTGISTPRGADQPTPGQRLLVKELLAYAESATTTLEPKSSHATYWRSMSFRVASEFSLEVEGNTRDDNHVLNQLVSQYFQNFSKLWPLLPGYTREYDSLHPILYLTLTSIGAMYCSHRHSYYGTVMHETIRVFLTAAHLDLEDTDEDSMWLAQSRLLAQVGALYFGQKKGFSFAQHLGAVLVAQARRMNIFSTCESLDSTDRGRNDVGSQGSRQHELTLWSQKETRKRLAFGILRAETYTSVLLNTRPNVSSEELDIELPCNDELWQGDEIPQRMPVPGRTGPEGEGLFSDMVRIRLEREEPFSNLPVKSLELLLFGLQNSLWRFCRDPDLFDRLGDRAHCSFAPDLGGLNVLPARTTVQNGVSSSLRPNNVSSRISLDDYFSAPSRQMTELRRDNIRLTTALQNWRQSLAASGAAAGVDRERSSLLSSLLLYHLSFLRLYAPIARLHYISYRCSNEHELDDKIVGKVRSWADRPESSVALQHACIIYSLLQEESRVSPARRARFNFLAFVGLHHAAVVVWTLAGNRSPQPAPEGPGTVLEPFEMSGAPIPVDRPHTGELLSQFIGLFNRISPTWSRRSSFAAVAAQLSRFQFPLGAERTL